MPLLLERSLQRLQGETMNELISSTPITRATPGAKARALLQTVNRKVNKAYQELDVNILQSFLPYATGRFLEYIGDMLGLPRLGASKAVASIDSKTVKFSVATGTFGTINSGNDISIPSGTLISTQTGSVGIVFRTTSNVILNRLLSEQYVPVEALRDGDAQNVGVGQLRFHNFTSLVGSPRLLLVSNTGAIYNGASLETDTNYRFRLASQSLSAERANETSIRLALLVIPGVADLVTKRYARGIGTYDIIIQSVIPNTPASVIEACQEAISRVQAEGIDVRVYAPRLTGIAFNLAITWRNDATVSDRIAIKPKITETLSTYINNLSIGAEFIVNEAIERVMSVDNKIKNIGTAQEAFDNIFIYRTSRLRDNKIKEELLGDFDSEDDERLIIEPTISNPIVLTDKN